MSNPVAKVVKKMGQDLDTAPCGFLRFSDDGTVVCANTTLANMLGLNVNQIEGSPISAILTQGAKVFFQTHLYPSLRMHGQVKELYVSLKTKKGTPMPVLVNAVRNEYQEEAVTDCVIVEIVERSRFEEALVLAKKEAERANKLKETALVELKEANASLARAKEEADAASRAKDDFLAALSHELRTPLTPVLLIASTLEKNESLPRDIREQMSMMRRNIELEATLIDDLLDVTRIRHGKLTLNVAQVDIHEILKHTAEIVLNDCEEKQINLTLKMEAPRHHLSGDAARIEQVIWNLVKNAIKFSPERETIVVTTGNDDEKRIVVEVIDKGVGIPVSQLKTIFDQFEQGHATGRRRFGGLGLGLSISNAIVKAHGGELHAFSEGPGLGATFSLSLDSIAAPKKETSPVIENSANSSQKHILLVEDHETTRLVISRTLKGRGHEVVDVGSLAEAQGEFQPGKFDLVISDLGLPDGCGLDLMREIRDCCDTPSIALSGFGMPEDVRRMTDAGFSAHLIKPIKLDQLFVLIHEVCDSSKIN